MDIVIDGTNVSIELLDSQKFKNMEVIPVRINSHNPKDYLTLKRGISAGFVEITECEISTVGTVLARNNASIPLVLIDGDEIVGAKQNRIMNRSLIIQPKSTMPVSVSCTEQGRWHYGRSGIDYINGMNYNRVEFDSTIHEDFDESDDLGIENFHCSDFAADFSTRSNKSRALFENRDCQSTVWNSINELENKTSFKSRTSALNDNYVHHRVKHNEYLRNFRIEYGQSGAIFIIDGQIKGLELFGNPSIYHDYHEKILRSYIMDAIANLNSKYCDDIYYSSRVLIDDIKDFLRELSFSEFRQSENRGIGRHLQFANNYGTGATLLDGNNLVHLVYFNQIKFSKVNKRGQTRRYGSFRDFAENFD